LNDEKELGHVANAGTAPADAVHARVGREEKCDAIHFSVIRPSRLSQKWSENVNRVNTME